MLVFGCVALTSCSDDDDATETNREHTYEVTISGSGINNKLEGKMPKGELALLYAESPDIDGFRGVSTTLTAENLSITLILPMDGNNVKPLKNELDGETNSLIMITIEDSDLTLIGISGEVSVSNLQTQMVTPYSGTASGTITFTGQFADTSDESRPPVNVTGKIVVIK